MVFLTAHASNDFLQRAKLVQPFAYLLKPFSHRELRIALEMAFYKHKIDTQLRDLAAHQILLKENERKQIARELHDDPGSLLHGIKSCIEVLIGRTDTCTWGIIGMFERAHTFHAELKIERGASGGTLATLQLATELAHD